MAQCPHVSSSNVATPTHNSQVFKDECTLCFANNLNPHGVDVCLSCFNGGCSRFHHNHAFSHSSKYSHPLVVNLRLLLKQKLEVEESPKKLSKLAISGESEDEKYEILSSVKCYACDSNGLEIDFSFAPRIRDAVDGVIAAVSARKRSDIQNWEVGELTVCDHVTGLEQGHVNPLEPQSISHCSECDLKENLWLCLTCGNLGCGRQQMGGLAGNGHGLSHFLNSAHPISCKLGTITPEGTADIYCYACDYERIDPNLAGHLKNFGINIASQQKTERTITELNLEFQNFQFGMTSEDGKLLEPLFGPGYTGLANLGNSCYMASVLQLIFSLNYFQNRYLETFYTHTNICHDQPASCFVCQMSKLAHGIHSGQFSDPPVIPADVSAEESQKLRTDAQIGIAPFMFKSLVGKDHPEFSTMRQQDAFEFLQHLIRTAEIKERANGEDPTTIFKHTLEDRLQCTRCHRVRYGVAAALFDTLQVPVRSLPLEVVAAGEKVEVKYEPVTLLECIRQTWSEQDLEYTCAECKTKTNAVRETRVKKFPSVFVFTMNRFVFENYVPKKFGVDILAPEFLDLEEFRGVGLKDGEIELPQEEITLPSEPQFNQEVLGQLEMMGFPANRGKKALQATGNSGDVELAMNWLIEHMEDPDIDDPIKFTISAPSASTNSSAPEVDVTMLCDMGFTPQQANYALKQT
ncbi:hypothetical protein HK096_002847, partial [Nowakowskiella sp. JEL0078]